MAVRLTILRRVDLALPGLRHGVRHGTVSFTFVLLPNVGVLPVFVVANWYFGVWRSVFSEDDHNNMYPILQAFLMVQC